jgi:hypothetical protein
MRNYNCNVLIHEVWFIVTQRLRPQIVYVHALNANFHRIPLRHARPIICNTCSGLFSFWSRCIFPTFDTFTLEFVRTTLRIVDATVEVKWSSCETTERGFFWQSNIHPNIDHIQHCFIEQMNYIFVMMLCLQFFFMISFSCYISLIFFLSWPLFYFFSSASSSNVCLNFFSAFLFLSVPSIYAFTFFLISKIAFSWYSRGESIVFYSRIIAIIHSDDSTTRLRLVLQF